MLLEVMRVKQFGKERGLEMHSNYESFVDLGRRYVVWFVNASHPLAFYPLTFSFPIVGSFPGLSWFDESRARHFAQQLEGAGWDVNVRGVSAFSTGGWFKDPILSSMFYDHPAKLGLLANTILHESVHATVLLPNQQYFNESLASFIADTMTPHYLAQYYGAESEELKRYLDTMNTSKATTRLLVEAFNALNIVYSSQLDESVKRSEKQRIMDYLMSKLPFEQRPNNATLIGFQLYQAGTEALTRLLEVCQRDWHRFIAATRSIPPDLFPAAQSDRIAEPIEALTRRQCEPFEPARAPLWQSQQLRRKRARQPIQSTSAAARK